MKKRLSILLSLLIALSCFNNVYAGCGSNAGNDSEQGTDVSYVYYYDDDDFEHYYDYQEIDDNHDTELETTIPTRDGYTFVNWNTRYDGSGITYVSKTESHDGSIVKIDYDLNLYAQWERNSYVITFDANGGTGTMDKLLYPLNSTDPITLASNTFTHAGNITFKGWNTCADGTGTSYVDEASITISDDITLYAQWNASYAITYNSNEGSDVTSITSWKLPDTLPTPIKVGYTFGGWYIDNTFTTAAVAGSSITSATTLYAKWLENHTVSFVVGEDHSSILSQTVGDGLCASNPNPTIDETNSIEGWYTDEQLQNKYDFNVPVTQDITLYAKTISTPIQLGDTKYSISNYGDALKNITGDITITLLGDVDLGNNGINIVDGQNIILNLNGHTLKSNASNAINMTGGNLTIDGNGKIVVKYNAIKCVNNSDVTSNIVVNNGTFEAGRIVLFTSYSFGHGDCNVTINGGNFTSTGSEPYSTLKIYCPGIVNVNGGIYNAERVLNIKAAEKDVVDDRGFTQPTHYAFVTLNDGTFNGYICLNDGVLKIKGGSYTDDDIDDFIADGYSKSKEDGRYVVSRNRETKVAKIGETQYYCLQDAIDAAQDNVATTITLIDDVKENVVVNTNKNITLNLNKHIITPFATNDTIVNYGKLSITGGSNPNDKYYGSINAAGYNACINNVGELKLDNTVYLSGYYGVYNVGTLDYSAISKTTYYGLYSDNGTALMNGGVLYGYSYAACIEGGTFTMNAGKVYADKDEALALDSNNDSKVIINGGELYCSSARYATVYLDGDSTMTINNATIYNSSGRAICAEYDSTLTINGGTFTGNEGKDAIDIYDNATVTILGGTITGDDSGIYSENCNSLTINGGNINGFDALYIIGGNIKINGGNFTGNGEAVDGDDRDGAAICVSAAYGDNEDGSHNIVLNVNDGTFTSLYGYALEAKKQSKDPHETPIININNGYFKSAYDKVSVINHLDFDGKISISGGHYSNTFDSSFIASNYYLASTSNKTYPYAVRKVVVYDNDDTKDTTTEKKQSTTTSKVKTETKTVISSTETLIKKVDGSSIRQITTKDDSQVVLESDPKIIPTGTILEKSSLSSDSEEYKQVQTIIESNETLSQAKDIVVYNFDLIEDNGTKIHELDGYVEVSLPVPDELKSDNNQKIVVYRVNEDGTLTKCETTIKDGVITFKTNHFSTYIFVLENDEPVNEVINNTTDVDMTADTNNHSNVLPIVLISLFVVIVLVALIVLRKRNRK